MFRFLFNYLTRYWSFGIWSE